MPRAPERAVVGGVGFVEFVAGVVGWDWFALAWSGKMERATLRAASVAAGVGRVDEGVGGGATAGADVAAADGCGCGSGWVGRSGSVGEAGRALRGSV